MSAPRFPLGQVVATPGALCATAGVCELQGILSRHAHGDWGCVCPEDAEANDRAISTGARILSAYPINPSAPCAGYGLNCVWVITEADHSVTTILLPDEY
ncbi:type I restriction endonuclease subunit M [Accumulibacter sp.]|uniref:type I restriction endonuclease subunit M n=1 Tax=Accumulibacter sp. TaxID=2053492 RepID=UPI002585516B|nr:type I restriction endonuclease subunit M [Accumulibacter sp.]